MALGSVAGYLAHANPAPLAVIRPAPAAAHGPVVVGVDGSPGSDAALRFAFRSASVRGATLLAVHCCMQPQVAGQPSRFDEAMLADRISVYRGRYPTVPVQSLLSDEQPQTALLRSAETAQLVVVGSHGHNAMSGSMLGSTGQALISRSAAPIVIVPSAT